MRRSPAPRLDQRGPSAFARRQSRRDAHRSVQRAVFIGVETRECGDVREIDGGSRIAF
jgi:hypothetical protein